MTGERLEWHKVASHLRCTVQDARTRLTFSEFLDWLAFLSVEEERDRKQDYYLAQIAAEVRRGQVTSPKSVKVKDFLIKFTQASKGDRGGSKHVWASLLKIDLEKKK